MNIQSKIAARIKSERQTLGISQEKLAGLSNIDRTYMQSIEKGERNISIETLFKIAQGLNMSASDLLKDIKL